MIDITPADQEIVTTILKKHVPNAEVRVFGSRHKWTAKPYSDLDLAIVGDAKLDKQVIYDLEEAFEESELSFRVDVIDWYAISDEFRAIIEQGYTVIQEKKAENKLPAGWVVKKLGDVVDINKHSIGKFDNLSFINYLDTGNITEGRINQIQKLIIGKDKVPSRCKRKVSCGDVLYSTVRPNQKHFGYLSNIYENMIVSTGFCVIHTNELEAHSKYIYYFLTLDSITEHLQSIAEQSKATYPSINPPDLLNLDIILPPIEEQKEIAAILSSLDDKIELNQQINKKLEEMAQAIFKEWFIDFNFPDENGNPYRDSGGAMIDSELGQIPASWSIKSLDEIAEFTNGLAMQKFRPTEHEKSLPVLKIKELRQGNTDINSDRCTIEIPDNVKISDGDVIFSWSGSLMIDLWTGGKAGLNQHLFKVTSDKYPKAFYYLWIKYYLARFIAIAQDKATTLGHIQRRHLTDAKVFCPNDKIMQKFNDVVTSIIEKIIKSRIEIRVLTSSIDTLLPKLMLNKLL